MGHCLSKIWFCVTSLLVIVLLPRTCLGTTARTAAELEEFYASGQRYCTFSLSGVVQHVEVQGRWFCLQDETGRSSLGLSRRLQLPAPGDEIIATGIAAITRESEPVAFPTNIATVGKKDVAPALDLRIAELDEREHNFALVRIAGTVIDILPDEVDPTISFLLVKDNEAFLPVAFKKDNAFAQTNSIVNAKIRLSGLFYRSISGLRKFAGPIVYLHDPATLEILRNPPEDPFGAPRLESRLYLTPRDVFRFGRRSVCGQVAAVWGDKDVLIQEDDGRLTSVTLAADASLPNYGTRIKAVGYPEADIIHLNLTRARYRVVDDGPPHPETEAEELSAKSIVSGNWHDKDNKTLHGKLIRLRGVVRSVPSLVGNDRQLLLDSGGVKVQVDISANPGVGEMLEVGCEIEVTGRCILETEVPKPSNPFPRITGFFLVPRTPTDVQVLSHPPWWTPARLLAALGIFVTLIAGLFVWNAALRRLVERRGRALYREQIARERSELRTEDRTQLAVELHDSISQNLTGASLQIDTVKRLIDSDRAQASRHLDIAAKTLTSCRQELRNCIWDLRNYSLDERDLNSAIRRTIELFTGDAELQIRFNVSRKRLSDNTTYALMRIVRELATNAVRHGEASVIRIAGTLEGDQLLFSVADNGRGFNPDARPGIADGHFGLQGIEERIEDLNGGMKIISAPGKGTKVTIWIKSES